MLKEAHRCWAALEKFRPMKPSIAEAVGGLAGRKIGDVHVTPSVAVDTVAHAAGYETNLLQPGYRPAVEIATYP